MGRSHSRYDRLGKEVARRSICQLIQLSNSGPNVRTGEFMKSQQQPLNKNTSPARSGNIRRVFDSAHLSILFLFVFLLFFVHALHGIGDKFLTGRKRNRAGKAQFIEVLGRQFSLFGGSGPGLFHIFSLSDKLLCVCPEFNQSSPAGQGLLPKITCMSRVS